jgi:hypothetical protein
MGGGTISVTATNTLTFSGSQITNAILDGAGTFTTGATAAQFNSVTSTMSATINSANGADRFNNFNNNGTLNVAAALTAAVGFSNLTNQGSGVVTINSASPVTVSNFQSYGMFTIANSTTATKTLVTNTGTTPLYFDGGSRTFIGVAGGGVHSQLELNGKNAIVDGGLFVNNGYVSDSSALGTSTVIADYGALVKGAGQYDNSPITRNGGRFQAGNSPGVATMGRFVFGAGGVTNYVFAIDDATGTAGPTPNAAGQVSGWGLVKASQWQRSGGTTSGDFAWTASPTNPLTVAIDTLVNPTTVGIDVPGIMADFDPSHAYSWPAVEWVGSYSGPTDAASLNSSTSFDTSGFANPIAGTFGWVLNPANETLSLTYTPSAVPEPGTLALVGVAAFGWVTCRTRRQRTGISPDASR